MNTHLYGKHEDPCKMTYSRMAFTKCGLPDNGANSNKHEEQAHARPIWHGTQGAQARRWAWGGAAHL